MPTIMDCSQNHILWIKNGWKVNSDFNNIKPAYINDKKFFFSVGIFNAKSAFYFDNFDPDYMTFEIKQKLAYYNENKIVLQNKIINHADNYSWESCIKQYISLYRDCMV